jgi:hypothetical protein
MNQIPLEDWPECLNDKVLFLDIEPDLIKQRTKLSFSESFDSLDSYSGCVFSLSGRLFGLIRYKNNPISGLIVVAEAGVFDPLIGANQFRNLLDALCVPDELIKWIRPS